MSMQIVVETKNVMTKATSMKRAKRRWKRWEKIWSCKRQTTWDDKCKRQTTRFLIFIECFEMIVFDRFDDRINWCTFECEVDYLLAKKKNACEELTTTRHVNLIKQIKKYFRNNFDFEIFETRQKVWRDASLIKEFARSLIILRKRVFLTIYQIYWHRLLNEYNNEIIHR